jgi:aminopeptidase
MKTIFEQYAELLVKYSLELKKGDKVLVRSTYLAEGLLREVYRAMLGAGAHPEFQVGFEGAQRIFYEKASDAQLKYVSPTSTYIVDNYEAVLNIEAPFNVKELQNVPAPKKQTVSIARADLNKTFFERAARKELKWNLCVFPTNAAAQECGMSLAEYEDFVYSACFLYDDDSIASWEALRDRQQKIVDMLNTKETIEYKSADVDITFSCKGREWINSAGQANMPSGEVFTSPVEDSVNGKVRFSYPGIYMGQEIEDISLEVKDGQVVRWDAKKGKELLDSLFEIDGARRFGEVAVGTNEGIKNFTKNMLFDEKIGGTIHMAVGASIKETGGQNDSAIHWDMLADMTDGGQIFADGELVYENGRFLIDG